MNPSYFVNGFCRNFAENDVLYSKGEQLKMALYSLCLLHQTPYQDMRAYRPHENSGYEPRDNVVYLALRAIEQDIKTYLNPNIKITFFSSSHERLIVDFERGEQETDFIRLDFGNVEIFDKNYQRLMGFIS